MTDSHTRLALPPEGALSRLRNGRSPSAAMIAFQDGPTACEREVHDMDRLDGVAAP